LILHYFEVDLEEKQYEIVKTSSEIKNGSISKMGFTKVGGRWVSKDGDQEGSSSGAHIEEENEGQVAATSNEPTCAYEVGPSDVNMEERMTSISPFERLVVNRLDKFAHDQRPNFAHSWV